MRTGIAFTVAAADRARLEAIVADRNRPQKHVWRARIILLTSAGVGTSGIERETGKDKTCVWRWQERFMLEGIEVVFIVIALGAGGIGLLLPASFGALTALVVVVAVGIAVHRPLSRIPENTLKFAVGVMLSAFGMFWTGEGLGVAWPGADLAIVAFAALFLALGLAAAAMLRRPSPQEALP